MNPSENHERVSRLLPDSPFVSDSYDSMVYTEQETNDDNTAFACFSKAVDVHNSSAHGPFPMDRTQVIRALAYLHTGRQEEALSRGKLPSPSIRDIKEYREDIILLSKIEYVQGLKQQLASRA